MVEFALVLPLLLLLLIAIIDFGRALFVYSEVSNAAREAVRYGAVNAGDCGEIANRARSMISLAPGNPIGVSVFIETPNNSGGFSIKGLCGAVRFATGDRVRVDVQTSIAPYTLQMIAPLFGGNYPNLPITYTAARSVVPPEGVATGPTTTARPTKTPLAGFNTYTPTPTPEPPGQPTGFTATSTCHGSNSVDATWTAPNPAGASYSIFDASNPASPVWQGSGTSANNFATVPTNSSRTFYVVAYNALGVAGPASNLSTVVCGTAPTLTPLPSPTNTPTPFPTPTSTNTPTKTPTPTITTTPTPGPSPTPTDTPTPTATPSPTATPVPILVNWATGYPVRQQSGPNKQGFFKVQVTFLDGTPVNDATVYLYDISPSPAVFVGTLVLVPTGGGFYGVNPASSYGDCLNTSLTTSDVFEALATRQGATGNVMGAPLAQNQVSSCP